jgi:hypothetical protein
MHYSLKEGISEVHCSFDGPDPVKTAERTAAGEPVEGFGVEEMTVFTGHTVDADVFAYEIGD